MKKKLMLITVIFLLISYSVACAKNVDKDISTLTSDESTVTTEKEPEKKLEKEPEKDSEINEERASEKEIDDRTTPVPSKRPIISSGNSDENNKTNLSQEKEDTWFTGKIGDSKIHAKLDISGDKVTGVYYYDKNKEEIKLEGYYDYSAYLKDYHMFFVYEGSSQKSWLIGLIRSEDYIVGLWKSEDKEYPMYLIREGSDQTPPKEPGSQIMKMNGYWNGMNNGYFSKSSADIYVLFDDLIYYELFAMNGTHSGELESFAIVKNKTAESLFQEQTNYTEPKENISFRFQLEGDNLVLDSNKYDFWCGMGVGYDSKYTKEDIEIPVPTALELEIVDTQEQEDQFRELTGDQYESFIQLTQFVAYEDITMDGKTVKAGESYLRGMNGCCYYILSENKLYLAFNNYESIDYYTNDSEYMDKLPQPMLDWAGNMKINYHKKK